MTTRSHSVRSGAVDPARAMDEANRALDLANTVPSRAIPVAADALAAAKRAGAAEAAAVAEQAWGNALLHGGEVSAALRHLRRSVAHATAAGHAALAGAAAIKVAFALVQRGQASAGLHEIDAAVAGLRGTDRARARAQRGIIKYLLGDHDGALSDLDTALAELRAADDRPHVQRALINRGIVLAERHEFAAAHADLVEADGLARALGRHLALGMIAQNLGYVELLRGDVPAALAAFDQAETSMVEHGGQPALVLWDRAELLLSVGLVAEARQAAERAVEGFAKENRRLMVPVIRMQLAHAAFLDQDWAEAVRCARLAGREFTRQRRPAWAAQARLTAARARLAAGGRAGAGMDSVVETLTAAGWIAASVEARLVAGGEVHLAAAARVRRRGPVTLRARGWYAEALLRQSKGDVSGAAGAVRTGLRLLDEHSTALGAADLRVHSAVHRRELAALGLRMALADGRPARVFEWAERGRASRLWRAARPPHDPELAELLSRLRSTAVEISRVEGRNARLTARQVELERQIRDHVRLRPGTAVPTEPVSPASLDLGDAALVEFVRLGDALHAVTVVDGTVRLRALGSVATVVDLVDRLPFALHRLASPQVLAASRDAAASLLRTTADRLDALLLRPLPEVADRPLVIVPTGPLHSVAWSTLPSCQGIPVTVSPSATLWHSIGDEPDAPTSFAVAAGPGLPGAEQEAVAVAAIHGVKALVGADATVHSVLSAVDSSEVVHLAAHGKLTAENPLFSELLFHDGPLVVHDIEQLGTAARTVVLAACDSGRSAVRAGDELLGLAAAFIGHGTAHLVASVIPVPDAQTKPLMVAFHRFLAAGDRPAHALARAATAVDDTDPATLAATAGFVCLGR
ncbi:CHAT domain-containing protein [Actinokineospora sp. HUAS TT18]|uniref:CHAT domain-containing protein n=1 Tax=Actinokineospora sp. HUAS TT18 TaxID=3447451 RepID=UPI003F51F2AA